MDIIKCIHYDSANYGANQTITPKGIMVHSTGANNPNLCRYCQPSKTDSRYNTLLALIGTNRNNNSFNDPTLQKGVHAFIGLLADGSMGVVQTLPWTHRAWHCGGSCNGTHIAFEICEDDLTDEKYFKKTWKAAVELCSYLCDEFDLDADQITTHEEAHRRDPSSASGHGDPAHWWSRFGKTIDDFRKEVEEMSYKKFCEYMAQYQAELGEKEVSEKSKLYAEYQEAISRGITDGTKPYAYCTRLQAAIMVDRATKG